MTQLNLSSTEMEKMVSLKEAYLIMYSYLEKELELCSDQDIGEILSGLSLWDLEDGNKAPMDGAILPTWLESAKQIILEERNCGGFKGANIKLKT